MESLDLYAVAELLRSMAQEEPEESVKEALLIAETRVLVMAITSI